jgi:hypothetical protein
MMNKVEAGGIFSKVVFFLVAGGCQARTPKNRFGR